jgi:hypothetical protein
MLSREALTPTVSGVRSCVYRSQVIGVSLDGLLRLCGSAFERGPTPTHLGSKEQLSLIINH